VIGLAERPDERVIVPESPRQADENEESHAVGICC
jgi:hypothetical protein